MKNIKYISNELAYEIVNSNSLIVGDPEKLSLFIKNKLIEINKKCKKISSPPLNKM